MTFQDGVTLFKSGDYNAAAEHFYQVTQENEKNHKAWNALGTCLSKMGRYSDANTCFTYAIRLDADNDIYKKNKRNNEIYLKKEEEDNFSLDEELVKINEPQQIKNLQKTKTQKTQTNNNNKDYQRNWLQIPVFFGLLIGPWMTINRVLPAIGISIWFGCAGYIKIDADSINAGNNPNASFIGRLKGWEWGLLIAGFTFLLLPLYSWKREQIFNENLDFNEQNQSNVEKISVGKMIVYLLCLLYIFGAIVGIFSNSSNSGITQLSNYNAEQYGLEKNLDDNYLEGQKAYQLLDQGKVTEALKIIDKILQTIPNNQDAIPYYHLKAAAHLALKENEKVILYSDKMIELDPNNPLGYSSKGRGFLGLRQIDEAVNEFDKAIQLNPDQADAWAGKGLALMYLEKYEEALEANYKAYQLNPNNDGILLQLAWLLNEMGRTDEANVYYNKALEISPAVVSVISKDEFFTNFIQ